jgi:hypothetical protein
MSTRTINSPFRTGNSISDRAVRRAIAYRRTVAAKRTPTAAPDTESTSVNDRLDTTAGGRAEILRRWSVAELITAATWRRTLA